jgi:DNA-binding XRE family transcriptional regulator
VTTCHSLNRLGTQHKKCTPNIFPNGNNHGEQLKYTAQAIGQKIRESRRRLGVTQKDLALTSGTGLRFIIDLEKGMETCQIGKVLTVLHTQGIGIALTPPAVSESEE